jgi:hypothetical protein
MPPLSPLLASYLRTPVFFCLPLWPSPVAILLLLSLAVAPFPSLLPRWATIFGPYHHLLSVRSTEWSACYEECMVVSVAA